MKVITDVMKERERQNKKWGKQRHSFDRWLAILVEEVGEFSQAIQVDSVSHKPTDAANVYEELIHSAAVAIAAAEQAMEYGFDKEYERPETETIYKYREIDADGEGRKEV